ncbi:MAG: phage head morphogenesis protein [Alicyclobacillus sp.]|nr:phage head morphogenesis protein [Alicyclobacillus sp.]
MGKVLRDGDWLAAVGSQEYAEYLKAARNRFLAHESATVKQVKGVYERVARQLRREIEDVAPGTLRRGHMMALAKKLEQAGDTLNRDMLNVMYAGIKLSTESAVSGSQQLSLEVLGDLFDKASIRAMFASINEQAVVAVLSRTRHDGLKVSDRIWRVSRNARNALTKIVEDGVTRGLDSRVLARQVQQYLQSGVWTALKDETRRRLGVSRDVSMEAMRLAVTELHHAFHEGAVLSYRATPSYDGVYWRLSANHPHPDICDRYASHGGNGFWKAGDEPAKPHPWCRCVIVPKLEDTNQFVQRLRQWAQDPQSQPDIESWYSGVREWLPRPRQFYPVSRHVQEKPRVSPFVNALLDVGVSDRAARTAEQLVEYLRELTVQHDVEYAAMVEIGSGEQVGKVLGGVNDSVNVGDHINLIQPGKQYLHIHTHPRSSSFSDADIALLVKYAIDVMIVSGKDGTKYVMAKRPGGVTADPSTVTRRYIETVNRLRPKYVEIYMTTRDEHSTWKEHSNEVWELIADELGLHYIRVLPEK